MPKTIDRTTHALVIKASITESAVYEIILTAISRSVLITWANNNLPNNWKNDYKIVPVGDLAQPIIRDTTGFPKVGS